MKNLSIRTKLLIVIVATIVIVAGLIAVKAIYSLNSLTKENIQEYKKNAYEVQKKELDSYVNFAKNVVEDYHKRADVNKIKEDIKNNLEGQMNFLFFMLEDLYKQFHGKVPETELKNILLNAIGSARYGTKGGYFFVYNENAVVLKHPLNPTKEGKRYSKPHILNFIDLAIKEEKGLVSYEQTVPNKPPREKVSFVKLFKPFKWIIGTGAYLDNITNDLKIQALKTVEAMKFGKSGYFYIYDYQGNTLMHGSKPSLVGKNLIDLKSKNGVFIIQDLIKAAKNGGDTVKYLYEKPGQTQLSEKIGYATGFEPWQWMIGTGAYADEIEAHITKMQAESDDKIHSIVLGILLIALIVSVLVGAFVIYFINNQINKPLSSFETGLLNFFKYLNKETKDVEKIAIINNDEIGTMSKVVNQNIEHTKSLIDQDTALLEDVKRVVTEVGEGRLNHRIEKSTQSQNLTELKEIFNNMLEITSKNVCDDINKLNRVIENFAKLDFTDRVDDMGGVAKGLNNLAEIINQMLVENKQNGLKLDNSSAVLLNNVDILNKNSNEAAAALEETAAALEEITSNMSNNTENVIKMSKYANQVTISASQGEELANQTTEAMNDINQEVSAINEAISVIDQISFQTNILSLNAAVEAATAGEAGKGFAVVAQEVRNLASRSAEAANEIKALVENATQKANNGKKISDQMKTGYKTLNENIVKTIDVIKDVEMASKEQRTGIEQINDAVNNLDRQTQQNASIAADTQHIAVDTDTIAKLIVSSADEKEFIGKNDIKI
ncbi:MAG: cache domain-containing protein [Arcobacteraceae bacterium]